MLAELLGILQIAQTIIRIPEQYFANLNKMWNTD